MGKPPRTLGSGSARYTRQAAMQAPSLVRPGACSGVGRLFALPAKDLVERCDRNLDLLTLRRLGRDLLEPQARDHQRVDDARPREARAQTEQLERHAGDDRDREDPGADPPP